MCIRDSLAGAVAVHAAQNLDSIEHTFGGGRGSQLEHVEEMRRVAAQGGVALANVMQEIKIRRPRQCLRLGDTGGEGVPRHDGLNSGKRIAAVLLGLDQGLADTSVQPHLVIDRLAAGLKLLLMLVLGRVEQLADDAVVQVDDFIGDCGHALSLIHI